MKKNANTQKPIYTVFNADNYLSTGMTKQEILELKDAFDLLDTGLTGKIEPSQIKSLFTLYGVDLKNISLETAFKEGVSSGKAIDFSSFLNIFTAYFYAPKSRQTYKKVFRLFDDENMGIISAKNLRRVVKEMDLPIDQSQIEQMIQKADLNNDGVISQQQFYQIMTRISPKS